MKRIAFITGIMLVGMIALLESSTRQRREKDHILHRRPEHDDIWWGN